MIGLMVVFPNSIVSLVIGASVDAKACSMGCTVVCPKLNTDDVVAVAETPKIVGVGLVAAGVEEVRDVGAKPKGTVFEVFWAFTVVDFTPKLGAPVAFGRSRTFLGSFTAGFVGAITTTG